MQWQPIKTSLLQGTLPKRVQSFGMPSIVQYFIDVKDDFRAIKEDSYQMYYRGHVQELEVKDDVTAEKTLIRSNVLPSMKTDKLYKAIIILDKESEICQANCDCPSGKGPKASCKHIAAITYAIDEFVRLFTKSELDMAKTEQLSQWKRPRPRKIQPLATYDMPFEKQKPGKVTKELKGKHPSTYQLDEICDSDIKSAKTLIHALKSYQEKTGNQVGFLHVLDAQNPIASNDIQAPVGSIIDSMKQTIQKIARSEKTREEKIEGILEALQVNQEQRDRIERETKEQSSTYLWMRAREMRISASKCHRVITFTNRTSGQNLINEIIKPKQFSTAATQFGIQHENLAIEKYIDYKKSLGDNVTVEKTGLVIAIEKGFLAASPDGSVISQNGEKGLLEVKALPSFSDISPADACKISKYPVKETRERRGDQMQMVKRLKKNHQYYHQIQLQLYCCKHFATFVDFVILHVNVGEIFCERIFPDQDWQASKIDKMLDFYKQKVIPELLK